MKKFQVITDSTANIEKKYRYGVTLSQSDVDLLIKKVRNNLLEQLEKVLVQC